MMNLKDLVEQTKTSKNDILIGFGMVGTLSSIIMAVEATPKACRILEEEEEYRLECDEKFTIADRIKCTWKMYLPSAICYVTSMGCILYGVTKKSDESNAKILAAMNAVSISQSQFDKYKRKTREIFGDDERIVRESLAKDELDRNPQNPNNIIIMSDDSDFLCYDELSGRYFKSNMNKLEKVENELNYKIINNMYASLNDFFDLVGLVGTSTGEYLGWNSKVKINYTSTLEPSSNKPCMVINFDTEPDPNYDTIY